MILNSTISNLQNCLDESLANLTALMGQQNAYRGGKGSDAEKILSGRDGTAIKVNRANGTRIMVQE